MLTAEWFFKNMRIYVIFRIILTAATLLIISGCTSSNTDSGTDSPAGRGDKCLVQVNDQTLTVHDFNVGFENMESLYPYKAMESQSVLNNAKLMLLNQLIEEMVLSERAAELNINISDGDVEKLVFDIKKDYPDDEFKKNFLENAVSYNFWKNSIRKRLLMTKVVEKDLGKKVVITPEDIIKHYEEYYESGRASSNSHEKSVDRNKKIIKALRQEKTEKLYAPWLDALKKKYKVKINRDEWDKTIKGRLN